MLIIFLYFTKYTGIANLSFAIPVYYNIFLLIVILHYFFNMF